ncbi:hypothetical protein [Roseobacter sp.]|uniref:hypothetical protein n=1 Tax=Roseobacter sp. TaxID=1907202 RepID=UPI00385E291A
MRNICLALVLMASPLAAQDFSANSEAKTWNLYGEIPARFEAKVVDVLCELTGDCPTDCGAGSRQLGLIRSSDDVMVLPMKNSQPAFTGAAQELAPFCNQVIEVDGLLIEDEEIGASNIYLVQRIKSGEADWIKANTWTKKWAAKYPEAKGKGPWFRRDPRIKDVIAAEGYLGLGLEADATYAEENF